MNKTSPSNHQYNAIDKTKRGDERNEQTPRYVTRRCTTSDTRKKQHRKPNGMRRRQQESNKTNHISLVHIESITLFNRRTELSSSTSPQTEPNRSSERAIAREQHDMTESKQTSTPPAAANRQPPAPPSARGRGII